MYAPRTFLYAIENVTHELVSASFEIPCKSFRSYLDILWDEMDVNGRRAAVFVG